MMSEKERDLDYPDVDSTCWYCSHPGKKQQWCIVCDHEEAQCSCPSKDYQQLWEINRCIECSATW
jgi:hypothetical protein